MASMIRFPTTIKVGNPRLTRRCVRSCVEFYTLNQTRAASLSFTQKLVIAAPFTMIIEAEKMAHINQAFIGN